MTRQKPTRKGSAGSHGSQRRDVGRDAEDVARMIALIQPPDVKEEIRGQVKTWYAQAQAAVFVGAIQAQLLKTDVVSRLELATNILFITGIILNVTGAYFALMAASSLETDLNHLQAVLNVLAQTTYVDKIFCDLTPLAKRFVKPTHSERGGSTNVHRDEMMSYVPLEERCRSIRRHQWTGKLGSTGITLGFIACPAALGCLAGQQERVAMRIATFSVIGALLFARILIYFINRKLSR